MSKFDKETPLEVVTKRLNVDTFVTNEFKHFSQEDSAEYCTGRWSSIVLLISDMYGMVRRGSSEIAEIAYLFFATPSFRLLESSAHRCQVKLLHCLFFYFILYFTFTFK